MSKHGILGRLGLGLYTRSCQPVGTASLSLDEIA